MENELAINSNEYYAALLTEDGKHPAYKQTVKGAELMAPIVYGETPRELLEDYRPNDPQPIKDYRLKTYEPIVQGWYAKVHNTLKSGLTPGSYSVEWPDPPKTIPKDETPEQYFTKNYGEFGSINNYYQDVVTNWMNAAAAAVMVILPSLEDSAEYQDILPVIFPPSYVYWYQSDVITICVNHTDKKRGESSLSKPVEPRKFITITKDEIIFATAKDSKNADFKIDSIENLYGEMVGIRLGGNYVQEGRIEYPESYIAGVVPPWNKAIRLTSDIDAGYVTSMYAQRVQLQIPCSTCNETGYAPQKDTTSPKTKCGRCNGSKYIMGGGPFGTITINPKYAENIKASDVVHYASPDVAIVEHAEKRVLGYEMAGYSALNMDEINRDRGPESGYSKAISRRELDAFLSEYHNRVLDLMEWNIRLTCFYRYYNVIGQGTQVDTIIPIIHRPHRHDHVTIGELYEKLKTAKDAGALPAIIRQIQKDIALKEFGPIQGKRIIMDIDLDPFPGNSVSDLSDLDRISTLPPDQVFIKANLARFIEAAIDADPGKGENLGFRGKSIIEQRTIIKELAEAEMEEIPEPTQFNLENQVRKLSGEDA